MMMFTGKTRPITVLGRELTYFNQHSHDWTHLYEYEGSGSDLCTAGCGIFALCHCAQWLTGQVQTPEVWADFSCANGGRGDDGTDRPALLHALQVSGFAAHLGFRYEEDGLRNDTATLYDLLLAEKAVALCNLRVGHIVALVAAREVDGVKQVLAIDSVAESADSRVRRHVYEVLPDTLIEAQIFGALGQVVGESRAYAAFWVDADLPKDFNLLHRI